MQSLTITGLRRAMVHLAGEYLRRAPEHPGRWRVETFAMRHARVLTGHLPPRPVSTWVGTRMMVDGDSQAGRMLFVSGRYEPAIAAAICKHLQPGDFFVDGGAHIGFFTVLASRQVGPSGVVLAFEPCDLNAGVLETNIRLNGCQNVRVRREALSDAPGRVEMSWASGHDTGQATIRPTGAAAGRSLVDTAALQDLLRERQQPVSLIKLDLEGAELRAIVGMREILAADRPPLLVEITDSFLRQNGGSAAALYAYVSGLNYVAYHLLETDALQPLPNETAFLGAGDQFNALFLPGERSAGPIRPSSPR
jgi:FkbM family methyltransferase